jgi:hypothetical protein
MIACVRDCGREAVGKYARYCDQCRSVVRRKRKIWIPTPEIDALIRQAWAEGHGQGCSQFVTHRIGWPKHAVCLRALAIGAYRAEPREPRWTAEEIAVVEQYAWMGEKRIQMKLQAICGTRRTPMAIHLKRQRLGLRSGDTGGYSAYRLAGLMGIDPKKVSHQWIKFGWLKAERRGQDRTAAQGGDAWYIRHESVYRFVLEHPEEIDLGRVDRLWFLDLVTRGKIGVAVERAA